LNSNSAVDTGEPLVQSFLVTDGQVASFGGVRNPNIPGDDDGASDGKITTNIFPACRAGVRADGWQLRDPDFEPGRKIRGDHEDVRRHTAGLRAERERAGHGRRLGAPVCQRSDMVG
jgi:hypothetical protein